MPEWTSPGLITGLHSGSRKAMKPSRQQMSAHINASCLDFSGGDKLLLEVSFLACAVSVWQCFGSNMLASDVCGNCRSGNFFCDQVWNSINWGRVQRQYINLNDQQQPIKKKRYFTSKNPHHDLSGCVLWVVYCRWVFVVMCCGCVL